jgi:hypothetical protein
LEQILLQVAGCPDEESLLVLGVFLELLGADCDEVVDVESLSVDVGRA